METEKSGRSARRRRARTRRPMAMAILVLLATTAAVVVITGFSPPPATAMASNSKTSQANDARPVSGRAGAGPNEPRRLNLFMMAIAGAVVLVIALPLAGRTSMSRRRSIRRFQVQLRDGDVVALCSQQLSADSEHTLRREPPCPL